MNNYLFKVVIFGDGGVGKTSLVKRYMTGVFINEISMTIGVQFHVKNITIGDNKISLQIWDFAGEERFRFLIPTYFRGAMGGIFMYDITRYSSLKNIDDWFSLIDGICEFPILLVGGKLDLEKQRAVEINDVLSYEHLNKNITGLIECSAKTGKNVDKIISGIIYSMLKHKGITIDNEQWFFDEDIIQTIYVNK